MSKNRSKLSGSKSDSAQASVKSSCLIKKCRCVEKLVERNAQNFKR